MFNPIKWLLEKNEPNTKESTMPEEVAAVAPESTAATPVAQASVSTSVKDLAAAIAFIDDGVKHLGEGAKADLIALAQKYL